MSLVARLFAFIGLTLLLVAGGELINGLNLRQNRLVEARRDAAQLARIAELDMVRILEGTRQLLATLAKLPMDRGWDERACGVVEATARSDFEYDHIVATDRSGTVLCSSSGPSRTGSKAGDLEFVNRIVTTAGFSVGLYGVGAVSGNEVIRVGYPLVDDAGTVTGAIYAGINVTWLNTALNQWKLGENASIQITDRNGVMIAAYPDPRNVGKPIADELKPFLSAASDGAAEVQETGADVRLYGYTPALDADLSEGIAVFIGRDRGPIFADINRSIWLNAATVLAALLAAAIVAGAYVHWFLARPFKNLLTVAGDWREGNWSVRTGAASGIPEFDRLSQAFDRMAAEVANRDQSLRQERDFSNALVGSLPGLFMLIDQQHRYVRWNENLSKVTGMADEQLQGLDALAMVVPGDRDRARAKLDEGFAVGTATFEGAVQVKKRTPRILHFNSRTITSDGQPYLLVIGTDITERKNAEEALRRANTALQISAAVIENAAEGVMVIDPMLQIESVNPAFERITGYSVAESVGRTPRILFSGTHDGSFFQSLHEIVDAKGHWSGEIWNRRRNGELYPQETSINVLRDADGRVSHYASVFSDSTVRNQMEAKLRELSSMDGLTGIANRRTFDEDLAREWARAMRDGLPLSLIMTDIDHFKLYNDHYGHLAGDACLRQVASAINGCANRSSDLVARYGGEEFAAILPNAAATMGAIVAEKMRASVAALVLPHGASKTAAFVTISVGVATSIPQRTAHAADLIAAADRALYQAKDSGRNRVVSEITAPA